MTTQAYQNGTAAENGYTLVVKFGYEILQSGHTAIPNLILDLYTELGLTPAEMLFIIHLMQFQWSKSNPYPSRATIAQKMGVAPRQISKYVHSLKNKAFHCQHTKECDCPKYLVVTQRFDQDGNGQLSNLYDFSNLFFATIALAREKGLLSTEETPLSENARGGLSKNARGGLSKSTNKEDERSKKTNSEEGDIFRKGKALEPEKEGNGENRSYSHIDSTATGNQNTTRRGEQSNTSKAPMTQEEIERKKASGLNASGFAQIGEFIGIPAHHRIELQKQFGDRSEDRSQPRERHGHWKKAPLFIQGTIGNWFSLEMHDQAINSTITRVHRIFQQWVAIHQDLAYEELQDDFYSLMQEARARAKRASITKRTPEGQVNRTPFFLRCLEDLSGLRPLGAE